MNLILVHCHPDPNSLTMAITSKICEGFTAESARTADVLDLHREQFDPRMTAADLAFYRGVGDLPDDVKNVQDRLDKADALAFVFPMYWWSAPGMLKGWFDRVLTRSWAYDYTAEGTLKPLLGGLPVLLVAVAATDIVGFQKHGYEQALQVQLSAGVFRACGLTDIRTRILFESEAADGENRRKFLAEATDIGRDFQASLTAKTVRFMGA